MAVGRGSTLVVDEVDVGVERVPAWIVRTGRGGWVGHVVIGVVVLVGGGGGRTSKGVSGVDGVGRRDA